MNRGDLQKEVVKKAMADESFRAEFLKDPKEAIEKAFDFKVPDGVAVKIVEEDSATLSIILPKNTGELSDSELNNVAGGGISCFCYQNWSVF